MPVSKLKNLALLLLVTANLILLCLLVPRQVEQHRDARNLRQSLQTLCAKEQVTLDPETVPDTVTLYALELTESQDSFYQAATVLLGEALVPQDDSTRYLSSYESPLGSCQMGRSGSFSARLSQSSEARDLSRDARQVLQKLGFQIAQLSQPERIRAGVFALTAQQKILGVPVFSQGLTLTYANSRLSRLDGVFYSGTLRRVSDRACLSAADALVLFLSARFDLGWVGSSIRSMEQGYLRSETSAASTIRLLPVWKLETDTGSFYLNGMTGEIVPAS